MSEQEEALRQEFLALPKEQWPGKALRVIGDYMKEAGKTEKQPDKVWDNALAPLKNVLLELGQQAIYKDVADWFQRTCKPYWDDRKREERTAKAAAKAQAAAAE